MSSRDTFAQLPPREQVHAGGTVPVEDAVWIGEGGFPPHMTPVSELRRQIVAPIEAES